MTSRAVLQPLPQGDQLGWRAGVEKEQQTQSGSEHMLPLNMLASCVHVSRPGCAFEIEFNGRPALVREERLAAS
jgi:hypothetical protein